MILLEGYVNLMGSKNKENSNLEDAGVLRGCGGDERRAFDISHSTTKSGGA